MIPQQARDSDGIRNLRAGKTQCVAVLKVEQVSHLLHMPLMRDPEISTSPAGAADAEGPDTFLVLGSRADGKLCAHAVANIVDLLHTTCIQNVEPVTDELSPIDALVV